MQVGQSIPTRGANTREFQPTNQAGRILFGNEPIPSIQRTTRDVYRDTGSKTQAAGAATITALGDLLGLKVGANITAKAAPKVSQGIRAVRTYDLAQPQTGFASLPRRTPPKTSPTPVNVPLGSAGQETIPPSRQLPPPQKSTIPFTPTPDRGAGITKPFLSTSGYLSRFGQEGKQLDKLVNTHYGVSRDYATNWYRRIPTVTKLHGADKKDFGLVVQGLARPRSAKVAQAVNEWRRVSPRIRQDFIRASGEDIGDITNFYPRMVKSEFLKPNSVGYNAAVKHLIDSGQVNTPGEAVAALDFVRKATVRGDVLGSFKFSRQFDLPPEMYDISTDALSRYLQGAADSVAGAKVFGMDKTGRMPVADDLIARIAARGGDAQQVKTTFEQAMGQVRYGERAAKVSNVVRGVNVATKLGLGAITNSAQVVNGIIKNGYIDSLKGLGFLATKAGRQYARDTGAFTFKLINDLREASGIVTKGAKIGAPFFNSVEKFNRYFSATGGKFHAERLARRVNKSSERVAQAALRDLREMGVTGPIGKRLTDKQLLQAGRGVSDITQFVVAPQTLPGWASTPWGKLIAQYQTFSYKQTGFVNNQILKPLTKGDAMPLLRLLSVLPVGYGIYQLKDLIRLKDDNNDTATDKIIKTWRSVGGLGTPMDIGLNIKDAFKYSGSPSEFALSATTRNLGPTVGSGLDILKAGYSATQGKYQPAAKLGIRQLPVIGPTIANKAFGSPTAGTLREFNPDTATPEQKTAQAKVEVEALKKNSGYSLQKLSNGKYAYTLDGEVKQTSDLNKARQTIAKDAFDKSGANIKIVGDTVLRRTAGGTITSTPKIEYDYSLGTARLAQQKRAGDVEGYLKTAQAQLQNLDRQLQDPAIDELDAIALQNRADTLMDNIAKFSSYGGFTKPKTARSGKTARTAKAPKPKAPKKLSVPKLATIKSSSIKAPKISGIKVRKPSFKKTAVRKQKVGKLPKTRKLSVSKLPKIG